MNSAWLRHAPVLSTARIKLFCLPHAGGNASLYQPWLPLLPSTVTLCQVCLPARLERFGQPMPDSFPALIRVLADEIQPVIDGPWAIFGHSMGGAVAHELVLELSRRGVPEPELLAISGRGAPQFHQAGTLHQQSDEALCRELIRLDSDNFRALEHAEMREFILPAIRADYRLIETYRATPCGVLGCPLAIFWGTDDEELSEMTTSGWRIWSEGAFHQRCFRGGHFYLNHHRQAVVRALCDLLPSTY
ncbi:thioesterase [Salmonella enterica]|nr:thioesterase [Salmonella enterica]